MYRVELRPAAAREFRRLVRRMSAEARQEMEAAIDALGSNPRPAGCRLVAGTSYLRIRAGREYRVIYAVNDEERLVVVARVARRGEAT
ncbi:MAG: type II toxin-antitoxin system RelE/ParE family toxin [Chloroflexi bacterium]|nr:type II toxin-antitoxin system RelE/ParE family toxin [Chloroflexota bacterium]